MQKPTLHFYFDYISPYAYLAWWKAKELAKNRSLDLVAHPILFAGLLNHWGHVAPAEIPPKREWVFKDSYRYAALHSLSFECPKFHPFNPLLPLRLSISEVAQEEQERVIDTLWKVGWGEGIDLGSETEIASALKKSGLDANKLIEKAKSSSAKEQLKKETERAIEQKVFGVPTFVIQDELFWGNDRFKEIELYLDGKDPLDRKKVKEVLNRPRGADRVKK